MKQIILSMLIAASITATAQQNEGTVPLTACHSGDWVTPESVGEGFNLNVLSNGNATFYFYTYLDNGDPIFFTGVLQRVNTDCVRGPMFFSLGGEIFSDRNPQDVQRVPFFTTTICMGRGRLNNIEENDWGTAVFRLLDNPDTSEDESQRVYVRQLVRLTPRHERLCQ